MKAINIWGNITNAHPHSTQVLSKLRDGRAWTVIELTNVAKTDRESIQRFLNEMAKAGDLKVRINRKRNYYYLEKGVSDDMAAFLDFPDESNEKPLPTGMKYCRHCYNHLAGYVGVKLAEALVESQMLIKEDGDYTVTDLGWQWFSSLGIHKADFDKSKHLIKQCLDFSERKSHLGGQLGDALLETMLARDWFAKVPDSREIRMTSNGYRALKNEFDIEL